MGFFTSGSAERLAERLAAYDLRGSAGVRCLAQGNVLEAGQSTTEFTQMGGIAGLSEIAQTPDT